MGQNFAPLVQQKIENKHFYQRVTDGYINATELCKGCNKLFKDYSRLNSTKAFIKELSAEGGILPTQLIQTVKGGRPDLQGTWVHPQVAIHLGQWLNPKFAVAVSQIILDWSSGKTQQRLPYHLRRYLSNQHKIPHTHFSILSEMAITLIAPLERHGYIIPDRLIPDISQGRMFCKWLRDQGEDTDTFLTYQHIYEDGRKVKAKLYPIRLLQDFRTHFHEVWFPKKSMQYFDQRDKNAIPYLKKAIADNQKAMIV